MNDWVAAELAECEMHDVRHTKRLARLLGRLSEQPVGSIPTACCSGQGKKDTKLSYQRTFFIVIGAHVPAIRVLPLTVIEHLAVRDDIGLRFLTRGVRTMRGPCAFSATQKPLGNGIV
jgi:hypothetical protein